MTISSQLKRLSYSGNGSTTSFAYSFRILDQASLKVVVQSAAGVDSVKTITTDYTVSGVGSSVGGAVDFVTAPLLGETVSIILDPELTQLTDYSTGGAFPAQSHEDALDKQLNINKRSRDIADRSITLPDGDVDGSGAYDAKNNRIKNLTTGILGTDLVTKDYVDAQASGLVGAVIATGGVTNRTLQDHTGDMLSVKDFGALGNGSANDTASVQAACAQGGSLFFPAGTYMLDEVTITKKCQITLEPLAILKQRSITGGQDQAILKFSTGSDFSSVEGGQFDGNAAALTGGHTAQVMTSIRVVGGPTHIRVSNTYIHDFLHAGWYFGSGSNSVFENIHVKDCGKGCTHQEANNGRVENVTFEGISNNGKAIYQHATEFRDADNLAMKNVRIVDFAPDNSGLEPTATAFTFERMLRFDASGLVATGFTGVTKPGMGFAIDSTSRSNLRGLSVDGGYDEGISIHTCEDTAIEGIYCNLEYNTAAAGGIGVRCRTAGLGLRPTVPGVANNYRSNAACRNLTISNALVMGAEADGFAIQSGGVRLTNCSAIGNDNNGFRVDQDLANGHFANAPTPESSDVVLDACLSMYNGSNGVVVDKGSDVYIRGGTYNNNGQDSALGSGVRCGILINDVDRVSVVDVTASDTQNWSTKTNGASFQPGSTTGNQYAVSMIAPGLLNVGQHIRLVDAGGSGSHADVKIVSMSGDDLTAETSGPFTYSASGNVTALTGTFSTTDYAVAGSSGALHTEVTGKTWVLASSPAEWRRMVRVSSANVAVLDTVFSSNLSGASLQKLQVDVQPLASQQYGILCSANPTAVTISSAVASGNVTLDVRIPTKSVVKRVGPTSSTRADVASSGTIVIPSGIEYVRLTGTTGVGTITAGYSGQKVTLEFGGSITVTDGSNINIAGNFSATVGDTMQLVCDGTNWNEISRSNNA